MESFEIKSSTLNSNYEFKNDYVVVQGSFVKEASSGALQSISGSCYHNNEDAMGEYIGNFNGFIRNGAIKYDLSEMTRQDSNLVWNAIDAIEAEVIPVDE